MGMVSSLTHKGLAKLGNIVAEPLLWKQLFPSLAALAARKEKMFLPEISQKHFRFSDTAFASEIYVS